VFWGGPLAYRLRYAFIQSIPGNLTWETDPRPAVCLVRVDDVVFLLSVANQKEGSLRVWERVTAPSAEYCACALVRLCKDRMVHFPSLATASNSTILHNLLAEVKPRLLTSGRALLPEYTSCKPCKPAGIDKSKSQLTECD
jgi:hypothetical protein